MVFVRWRLISSQARLQFKFQSNGPIRRTSFGPTAGSFFPEGLIDANLGVEMDPTWLQQAGENEWKIKGDATNVYFEMKDTP
jgi:hypothetical protein